MCPFVSPMWLTETCLEFFPHLWGENIPDSGVNHRKGTFPESHKSKFINWHGLKHISLPDWVRWADAILTLMMMMILQSLLYPWSKKKIEMGHQIPEFIVCYVLYYIIITWPPDLHIYKCSLSLQIHLQSYEFLLPHYHKFLDASHYFLVVLVTARFATQSFQGQASKVLWQNQSSRFTILLLASMQLAE